MLAVGRFLSKVSQQTDLSTIQQYLAQAENGLPFERVSPAYRTVLIALFASMRVLINILLTNSQNSSVPPSQDPYNKKPKKNASGNKRPRGGQPKHPGHHRKHFEPDRVETLKVDRSQIPPDRVLKELEPEVRQVVNVTMSREVVEYRGEVLQDQYGNIYRAAFPSEARSYFQYGNSVKRYVTNLSTHQLIPYERLAVHMNELFDIPISPATIRNYIRDAAKRLSDFIVWLKTMILMLKIIYVDETGFNVGGKVNWVHIHCDENYTYLYTDEKRGKDATIEIGILPNTSEDTIIVHDCWAPYFHYTCQHALCSAHLLRELQSIIDKQGMEWPKRLQKIIKDSIKAKENSVNEKGVALSQEEYISIRKRWRTVLTQGEKEVKLLKEKMKGSRINNKMAKFDSTKREKDKKTKAEVLLERLREKESDYLLYLTNLELEPTNNVSERGIRIIKLRNKISGYADNIESAQDLCIIRSYIDTCRKHGVTAEDALTKLFDGKLPDFVDLSKANYTLFGEKEKNNLKMITNSTRYS